MPSVSEEEMKYYLEHTLKPTDTFSFDCQMCGKCCRKKRRANCNDRIGYFQDL